MTHRLAQRVWRLKVLAEGRGVPAAFSFEGLTFAERAEILLAMRDHWRDDAGLSIEIAERIARYDERERALELSDAPMASVANPWPRLTWDRDCRAQGDAR